MGETEKLEAEVANLYGQYSNRYRFLLGLENYVRKLQSLLDDVSIVPQRNFAKQADR